MAREETKNVLDENPLGSKSLDDSAALEEESRSSSIQSGSASGDTEVLAGESEGDDTRNGDCVKPPGSVRDGDTSISRSSLRWFETKRCHVLEDGYAWESSGEDGAAVLAGGWLFGRSFAEGNVLETGSSETFIESSDS